MTNPLKRNVQYAKNGMVATGQPLAAQAGLTILQRGGNAVDAAIATAACLTVVEPTSNGLGSDAFAIVWLDGQMHGVNASGAAPAGISIEAVRARGHEKMPVYGLTPVTVPGAVGGWVALNKRFGKLTLAECLAPAVEYARNGYPLSPTLAKFWGNAVRVFGKFKNDAAFAPWFETFAPNGRAPDAGEVWSSPGHANTLEEIGATMGESFYHGRLAQEIAAFSAAHDGFLTADDLAAYAPLWDAPLSVKYRGYDVWEMPPNGQGIVALMALGILDGMEPTRHNQMEALKLAFVRGMASVTDPQHLRETPAQLLDPAYLAKMRDSITPIACDPAPIPLPKGGTVYLATADGAGNMVSFIQSNYLGFGSGMVVPGTGIALQNRGSDFSLDPTHVNALAGGKRTYHTIIPGFLTKNGQAVGPFGVMGGYMQPQGHMQVLSNMLDHGMNPQEALDEPRWQWTKGKHFLVEPHFDAEEANTLAQKGHEIERAEDVGSFGRGQIILRDENGVLRGGTENRTDGCVAAY
ncbi:MAG: gamma-glutamyltransferase family protein [Defluviitaleaceae bacterium]|nr:gamma-glutamyltransferase family protein [Defluviitaleaceae bacterium]